METGIEMRINAEQINRKFRKWGGNEFDAKCQPLVFDV